MLLFQTNSRQSFGLSFIGQPESDIWSHFELINHAKHHGAFLISVKGYQAKNFSYECLSDFKDNLPLSTESIYRKLQSYISLATKRGYTLEFSLSLTEGRKVIFASYNAGIYLQRASHKGNLLRPQPDLQFVLGAKRIDDVYWLYSSQAKKQMLVFHQTDLAQLSNIEVKSLFSPLVMGDQAVGAVSFNQAAIERLTEVLERKQTELLSAIPASSQISVEDINEDEQKKPLHFSSLMAFIAGIRTRIQDFSIYIFQLLIALYQRVKCVKCPKFPRLPQHNLSVFGWWFGSNKVYLGQHLAKKVLSRLSIFVAILVILLVSLILIVYRQYQARSEVNVSLEPIKERLQNVMQLGTDQPVLARKQANDLSKDLIALKPKLSVSGYGQVQFENLYTSLNLFLESLSKRELKDVPVYDDLRNISPSFVVSDAGNWGQNIVFADAQQQLLIKYKTTDKKGELISLDQPIDFKSVALNASGTLLLENGVVKIDAVGNKINKTTVIAEGDSNSGGTMLATFETNLYVLNPLKRNIFRYVEEGLSYSKPVGWFSQPTNIDFSTISSMVVDGDLWLGTSKGEIVKFSGGKKIEFKPTDLPNDFSNALQLATTADHAYLYVLESATNRVVVLDKQGKFITQVISPLLGTATQLIFSDQNNLLLVVSGALLYQVPL